jgi:hypothetical protein
MNFPLVNSELIVGEIAQPRLVDRDPGFQELLSEG